MREYNPKHHSRATFTNSRVKFVVLPVLSSLLPLLPDAVVAAVVVIGVQSATIKRLPSGIFIFPVCPKTCRSGRVHIGSLRRCPSWPRHWPRYWSRTYIRPSSNFLFYEWQNCCCCHSCSCARLLLLLFCSVSRPHLPSRHWQENVRKCLPAVREKRAKRGGK